MDRRSANLALCFPRAALSSLLTTATYVLFYPSFDLLEICFLLLIRAVYFRLKSAVGGHGMTGDEENVGRSSQEMATAGY